MIPLQDILPRRNFPIMTYLLILINVLVFFYELKLSPAEREIFFKTWGVIPASFFDPYFRTLIGESPYHPYVTLITHLFIHGGWFHIIGNMWTLWIFGDNVEDRLGPVKFLIFYLVCGISATLFHCFIYKNSVVPLVGASGAISGVMGAYYIMYPLARIIILVPILFIPFFFEVPAFFYLLFWFFIQFYSGLFSLMIPGHIGGIAWFAHLGGFAIGAIIIKVFCRSGKCFYQDEYTLLGALLDLDKHRK